MYHAAERVFAGPTDPHASRRFRGAWARSHEGPRYDCCDVPAEAGIKFGHYVLLRRIARGGMAEVFLAQQRGLEGFDRRVAVKRILPHLADSPDFVKMFLGEAKLAAQLGHPNIVHIYEFGKVEEDYFIAMEYVEGVHAGNVMKHGEGGDRLTPTLIARIGADAATALHHAHELRGLGLVHRDVSPANIMVSFDGVVKLCDFGIAKAAALGDQLTNPGQVKGKYAYMSPEQTIAQPLDGRSDVFSLSIVLWELLAGRFIVQRGDAIAAMRALRDGRIEPIAKIAPHVPEQLAQAITWGLQTRREDRATATELAQALEAFIKSSPELATAMQLGGWVRQRFTRESANQAPAAPQQGPGTVAATSGTQNPVTPPAQPEQDEQDEQHDSIDLSTDLTKIKAFVPMDTSPTPPDPPHGAVTAQPFPSPTAAVTAQAFDAPDPRFVVDPADPRLVAPTRAIGAAAPPVGTMDATNPLRTNGAPPNHDGDESTIDVGERSFVADDELDSQETIARSSSVLPRMASAPMIVPPSAPRPRVGDVYAARRRRTPLPIRARRIRLAISISGLVGLAVLSFVIALAASGHHGAATPAPPDAAAIVLVRDAQLVAPPTPDAAPATTATVPIDANTDAYVQVTTTPAGATVLIGDQAQIAPAELVVTSGTFEVTIELAGYVTETRRLAIAPGERQQLELTLHKRVKKKR